MVALLALAAGAVSLRAHVGMRVTWDRSTHSVGYEVLMHPGTNSPPADPAQWQWRVDVGNVTNVSFFAQSLTVERFTNLVMAPHPGDLFFPLPMSNFVGEVQLSVRAYTADRLFSGLAEVLQVGRVEFDQPPDPVIHIRVEQILDVGSITFGFTNVSASVQLQAAREPSEDPLAWRPIASLLTYEPMQGTFEITWRGDVMLSRQFWRLVDLQ